MLVTIMDMVTLTTGVPDNRGAHRDPIITTPVVTLAAGTFATALVIVIALVRRSTVLIPLVVRQEAAATTVLAVIVVEVVVVVVPVALGTAMTELMSS